MSEAPTTTQVRPAEAEVALVENAPDAWSIPGTGVEWCDCGDDHELTRDRVGDCYALEGFAKGSLVPHRVVVLVTQDLWGYETVCRFFHLKVEDSARAVTGAVQASYPLDAAIMITGTFSGSWQGCPQESCEPVLP